MKGNPPHPHAIRNVGLNTPAGCLLHPFCLPAQIMGGFKGLLGKNRGQARLPLSPPPVLNSFSPKAQRRIQRSHCCSSMLTIPGPWYNRFAATLGTCPKFNTPLSRHCGTVAQQAHHLAGSSYSGGSSRVGWSNLQASSGRAVAEIVLHQVWIADHIPQIVPPPHHYEHNPSRPS